MLHLSHIVLRSLPLLVPALACLVMVPRFAGAAPPPAPPPEAGIWIDDSGAGAVEIYVCADRADRLCGRIIWLKEPLNAQGVPKRDRYNPSQSLQTRPICGLPVLGNLARSSGGFDGGWIYDPKVGKSYDAAIQLASRDRLMVTGYLGVKFLGKTFAWTRAPANLQRCEAAPPAAYPQDSTGTSPANPGVKSTRNEPTVGSKPVSSAGAPAKASAGAAIVAPQPRPAVAPSKRAVD